MRYTGLVVLLASLIFSCRGKKESIYSWKGEEEIRSLTLRRDNTFILKIQTDYFSRIDTGTFAQMGDTLIINPDKVKDGIDSVVTIDSLYYEERFIEVIEPEFVFDTTNNIIESFYRTLLFPNVTVNDSMVLSASSNDPSYKKLSIPDSIEIKKITVIIQEGNTCKPVLSYHQTFDSNHKSYRLFITSKKGRKNYLAGFKWLIKGDTIESFFANENCEPTDIKLVRER